MHELPLDNSWLEQYYDPLLHNDDEDMIDLESMDLNMNDADDGSTKHVAASAENKNAADERARKREDAAIRAKKYRDRLKMDPKAHADYRQKRNEKARLERAEKKRDPAAYAEFKRRAKKRLADARKMPMG